MESKNYKKIKAAVIEILDIQESSYDPGKNLVTDYGADSLDIIEIVMELEGAFGISIPDEDLDNLRTPQDILEYITSRTP